ncbi:hypothetical protein MCO_01872 [Bartonella sp. DB5-6]|nr:hypothetical protein MCO_01872 [Bartonella sp. DB5-6]
MLLFLNKCPEKYSVINDLNGEITNLFQCVKNHFDELAQQFEWFVSSTLCHVWGKKIIVLLVLVEKNYGV